MRYLRIYSYPTQGKMNDITSFRTMVVRKNKAAEKNMLKEKISADFSLFSEIF